jgi:putative multiple sugar transport system substrate-binding protein
MKKLNRTFVLVMALVLSVAVFATACGSTATTTTATTAAATTAGQSSAATTKAPTGDKMTVGISMPTKSSQRWIDDGNNMVKLLKDMGYDTNLQYGEDVIENQVSQIENMITTGVDCLVIAAIDGEALGQILNKAHDANIPVIAYDRLIRGSEWVNYYATFDNFKVGVQQATLPLSQV